MQKLQQRVKREEVAGKGSRDSVAQLEATTRDDYIFLSLKKKYDDLLQYALKVGTGTITILVISFVS